MAASVKRIVEFLGVTPETAKKIRAAMQAGEAGARAADEAMETIDRLLGTHGTEAIRGDYHVDRYHFDIVAVFCNAGDSYAATVLYETDRGRFVLTSWGDWVERNSERYNIQ